MGRKGCEEKRRSPTPIVACCRTANGEEKQGARREMTDDVEEGKTSPAGATGHSEARGLENHENQDEVDDSTRLDECLHPPQGDTRPIRWATSLKKMRTWAAGRARTSSLFM